MSRSKYRHNGTGKSHHNNWLNSKRPNRWAPCGRFSKTLCHHIERRIAKQELRLEEANVITET